MVDKSAVSLSFLGIYIPDHHSDSLRVKAGPVSVYEGCPQLLLGEISGSFINQYISSSDPSISTPSLSTALNSGQRVGSAPGGGGAAPAGLGGGREAGGGRACALEGGLKAPGIGGGLAKPVFCCGGLCCGFGRGGPPRLRLPPRPP